MRRFAALYTELERTTRTSEKVDAMERYFREVPAQDGAWGLYVLAGGRVRRAVTWRQVRRLAADAAEIPAWLVDECYDAVGDLAEMASLLVPPAPDAPREPLPLHRAVEERIVPLPQLPEPARDALIIRTWRELSETERFVWNKLVTGSFRVGAARTLAVRAMARAAGVPPADMAHRLAGDWTPTAAAFEALRRAGAGDAASAPGAWSRPYPFFLAHALEEPPETLGDRADWLAEWKWDGLRAQVVRRDAPDAGPRPVRVWSRGDEAIGNAFPEVAAAGAALPAGTVLDGEILLWRTDGAGDRPAPFAALQRRIGRLAPEPSLFSREQIVYLAYDLLEADGRDRRAEPLRDRRARLEALVRDAGAAPGPAGTLRLSPRIDTPTWAGLREARARSRELGVEGIMLKRLDAPYGVGRTTGAWWKWKIDPFTVDAVLVAAQPGHGRRAGIFTDYTFAVWDAGELVPVAKAYSGLTGEEIERVDAFVRRRATGRFGPVRAVPPELVFELAFEAIQPSGRHRSGVALRFPRIARWRSDKTPADADSLDTLRALLRAAGAEPPPRDR